MNTNDFKKQVESDAVRTPLLDSIQVMVDKYYESTKRKPDYMFVGKVVGGAITTELKKKNGGRAQAIDGKMLFGCKVHVMSAGNPEQFDLA